MSKHIITVEEVQRLLHDDDDFYVVDIATGEILFSTDEDYRVDLWSLISKTWPVDRVYVREHCIEIWVKEVE